MKGLHRIVRVLVYSSTLRTRGRRLGGGVLVEGIIICGGASVLDGGASYRVGVRVLMEGLLLNLDDVLLFLDSHF